ncbi:teichoic acid D-Ala incorporation-associated protein DltX [Lapidilactobacillus bayanensis]|nr:teichoic acid D-Ala incorporation-associated protein DltX [Lapidilactobacillus bayanensis]
MADKNKTPRQHEVRTFILKTLFYFVIIFMLVYLYSYVGINGGHFIYNEF